MSQYLLRTGWTFLALGLLAVVDHAAAQQVLQGPPGQYDRADIEFGARIYATQCAVCHGQTGDQIAGIDLASGRIRRATTDDDLRNLIATGIPNTAMPALKFSSAELTMIVAYVRNMRTFEDSGIAGDIARGRAIFEGKGLCSTCHRVNGVGPHLAPDLSDVGAERSASALRKTLLDPTVNMLPVNQSVRAVTKNGESVTGRRLNEDTHSVQVLDEGGRLISLQKSDLREYSVIGTSLMPSYKDKLTAQETADVLAYLLTLKGLN